MSKEEQLFEFVKTENLKKLNKLIGQGVTIDAVDNEGNTPLITAAANGYA